MWTPKLTRTMAPVSMTMVSGVFQSHRQIWGGARCWAWRGDPRRRRTRTRTASPRTTGSTPRPRRPSAAPPCAAAARACPTRATPTGRAWRARCPRRAAPRSARWARSARAPSQEAWRSLKRVRILTLTAVELIIIYILHENTNIN